MNKVAGMWRLRFAQATVGGQISEPFGPHPNGILVFAENLRFVEVLTNPGNPPFASPNRQDATADEARAAIKGSLGLYGTYTLDSEGNFSGNHVEGSTFPNWKGNQRNAQQLQEVVEGNVMRETFHDGDVLVSIIWDRIPNRP